MKKEKVAPVYARALMDSSLGNARESVSADMHLLATVFKQLPELRRLLSNPVVGSERKADLLGKVSGSLDPLTQKFLKLLEMKNRFPVLPQITEAFIALEESRRNILRATVYSAKPLAPEQLDRLAKGMEAGRPGKRFLLTNEIDASLLAGLRIRQGDIITDASLRHQLELLRQKLAA